MKKIVVATDFSTAAAHAAEYAVSLARHIGAELYLLHVATLPVGFSETPVMITEEELVQGAQESMSALKSQLSILAGNDLVIKSEINSGVFFDCLDALCNRLDPYLVVIGSQGKSVAERILFGSHALHTLRHIGWPVIAVPPGCVFKPFRQIGVAVDLELGVESLPLGAIGKFTTDFQAKLHFINRGEKGKYDPDTVSESIFLDEKLGEIKAVWHFIKRENREEGILDFATHLHLDLLIVLPGQHDFPENLFHKSETKELLLHSQIPLMALPFHKTV